MSLRKWRRVLESNYMTLLYHSYFGTAEFWVANEPQSRLQRLAVRRIRGLFNRLNELILFPNPLLSPYLVSVSKRFS